jgi:hypothetical protein
MYSGVDQAVFVIIAAETEGIPDLKQHSRYKAITATFIGSPYNQLSAGSYQCCRIAADLVHTRTFESGFIFSYF